MKPVLSSSKRAKTLAMSSLVSLSLTFFVRRLSHYWKSMVPLPSASRSMIIWKIAPFLPSNPREVMAAFSSKLGRKSTLDVDGSSLVRVEEVEGLLSSMHLFLTHSVFGVAFGIEISLLGRLRSLLSGRFSLGWFGGLGLGRLRGFPLGRSWLWSLGFGRRGGLLLGRRGGLLDVGFSGGVALRRRGVGGSARHLDIITAINRIKILKQPPAIRPLRTSESP
jgi:hypothetical protein